MGRYYNLKMKRKKLKLSYFRSQKPLFLNDDLWFPYFIFAYLLYRFYVKKNVKYPNIKFISHLSNNTRQKYKQ